ncbi:hypothetical protein [Leptolyngbya sp. FACHB-261]|uniref:hypothetical protein n=1 Tax=Leptolyngbya sp. FACHB-261 TaxID=2692806 RepID=UPI00168329D6|nr:hypothetical protein [Leptolyngbya sp. FACHB-261]MBD2101631.1 hypothetical protein [Leptolyngbya sp. FACHB-261]
MIDLIAETTNRNRAQQNIETNVSLIFGDMSTMKPCPLIKAEKLETQNGIRYNLKVCQWSLLAVLPEETLSNKPVPITALMPIESIHNLGEGSK